MLALNVFEVAALTDRSRIEPASPPPPPIELALIAAASIPVVQIRPSLMTSTSPAWLPSPPLPPTLNSTEFDVPVISIFFESIAPPTPPPPPIDWARMPKLLSPVVMMMPVLVTPTSPAMAPLPPAPPTAIASVFESAPS